MSAWETFYILGFELYVIWQIAQITSDSTYLLLLVLSAPVFMTLHKSGNAYLMYLVSGWGKPLQRLVTAHAPFRIISLSFVF